jgi:hypothetical protein
MRPLLSCQVNQHAARNEATCYFEKSFPVFLFFFFFSGRRALMKRILTPLVLSAKRNGPRLRDALNVNCVFTRFSSTPAAPEAHARHVTLLYVQSRREGRVGLHPRPLPLNSPLLCMRTSRLSRMALSRWAGNEVSLKHQIFFSWETHSPHCKDSFL